MENNLNLLRQKRYEETFGIYLENKKRETVWQLKISSRKLNGFVTGEIDIPKFDK